MKDDKSIFYYFGLLGQLGITMMVNILVCIGLYKLIERFTGRNGFIFIILVLLGVVSGFVSIYRMIMKLGDKNS